MIGKQTDDPLIASTTPNRFRSGLASQKGDEPAGYIPQEPQHNHTRLPDRTPSLQGSDPLTIPAAGTASLPHPGPRMHSGIAAKKLAMALPLGVLRRFSGPLETRFLALLLTGIAGQVTGPPHQRL